LKAPLWRLLNHGPLSLLLSLLCPLTPSQVEGTGVWSAFKLERTKPEQPPSKSAPVKPAAKPTESEK